MGTGGGVARRGGVVSYLVVTALSYGGDRGGDRGREGSGWGGLVGVGGWRERGRGGSGEEFLRVAVVCGRRERIGGGMLCGGGCGVV